MKKIIFAAAALLSLAACSKVENDTQTIEKVPFVKGQKVILTAVASNQSKLTSEISGQDLNFKWEEGDQIAVTVEGGEPAIFTLVSGAGQGTAKFEGEMPKDGDEFSIQFPVEVPNLFDPQVFVAEALPHNLMLSKAEGCTLSSSNFTLVPQNSAIKLNFYGEGKTIESVVIFDLYNEKTYTLDCGSGVALDETTPKSFITVVEPGEYVFSATAYGPDHKYLTSFATKNPQNLVADQILNMPALEVKPDYPGTDEEPIYFKGLIWAPVNCGYDKEKYPFGLLYQWGRKYGQTYDGETPEVDKVNALAASAADGSLEANKNKFYYQSENTNWYAGSFDSSLWTDDVKGPNDPCPGTWRVPSKKNLEELDKAREEGEGKKWGGWEDNYLFEGNVMCGFLYDTTPKLFIPAAGYRNGIDATCGFRGFEGVTTSRYTICWSTTVESGNRPYTLHYDYKGENYPSEGIAVRCVKDIIYQVTQ